MVLQNMMTKATMQNCTLGWSRVRNETAAPIMHIMPTLYTLIPMYLLSFKAGMLTFRVSQARKHPNNWNDKRRKKDNNYKRNWPISLKSINLKLVCFLIWQISVLLQSREIHLPFTQYLITYVIWTQIWTDSCSHKKNMKLGISPDGNKFL